MISILMRDDGRSQAAHAVDMTDADANTAAALKVRSFDMDILPLGIPVVGGVGPHACRREL